MVTRFLAAAAAVVGASLVRLPGVAAMVCGTAAAWEAFGRPAGLAVLAVFLLLADRRL